MSQVSATVPSQQTLQQKIYVPPIPPLGTATGWYHRPTLNRSHRHCQVHPRLMQSPCPSPVRTTGSGGWRATTSCGLMDIIRQATAPRRRSSARASCGGHSTTAAGSWHCPRHWSRSRCSASGTGTMSLFLCAIIFFLCCAQQALKCVQHFILVSEFGGHQRPFCQL